MKVLLCVCASVAIYKSCELIRVLKKSKCDVKVVLSDDASKMISSELFEALSGNKVYIHETGAMEHILLTRWCDIIVLCPATASTIGNIANGIGGSLLLDIFLAKQDTRTVIVPAMNLEMWKNVFVQENIYKLEKNGFCIVSPQCGMLACGEEGIGKLAAVEEIASYIFPNGGKSVLITAGGTIEKMDDVRYLTNISSGKQALEIAKYFRQKGWNITVIKAKTDVEFPSYIETHSVESANDMLACVQNIAQRHDVFISVAAVADFTFKKIQGKLKKAEINNLELISNPDILHTICQSEFRPKCVVGFAAESTNLKDNAKEKMTRKGCDIMVGNSLVFGKDSTHGIIFTHSGEIPFDCSKKELSALLFNEVQKFIDEQPPV